MKHNNNYPLVFIRGLLRSQAHWGKFKSMIMTTFPDRQCLFLNIPGNGELCHLTSPCHIRQMTLALITQLTELNLTTNKVDLVSISMGGMIALDWANYKPSQINSLVLINTSLKNFSPFYQRLQPKSWWLLLTMLLRSQRQKEEKIYQLTSNYSAKNNQTSQQEINQHREQTINQWLILAKQQPVKISNGLKQLFAAANFKLVKKPLIPITLINSRNDQLVGAVCSEQLAKAWHVELITHSWAGHDIALDDPLWLCQKLQEKSQYN